MSREELWIGSNASDDEVDDDAILEEQCVHASDEFRKNKALQHIRTAHDSSLFHRENSAVSEASAVSEEELFAVGEIPSYPQNADTIEFQRVRIDDALDDALADSDVVIGSASLQRALELHEKWTEGFYRQEGVSRLPKPPPLSPVAVRHSGSTYLRRRDDPIYDPLATAEEADLYEDMAGEAESQDGVYTVPGATDGWLPTLQEFTTAFAELKQCVNSGPVKSLAYKRLNVLEQRFSLHGLLNGERELATQKTVPHRDFYNVRKVDTHVHHSACMNQKHLLRFIKAKLRKEPQAVVCQRDGKEMTLAEVFKSLHLTAYDLSIDTLDMHAHDTFHRFDRFNLKYNPAGQSRLREIFLKTDNMVGGRFLAELTREVIADLEASKYQLAEWRVSVYGRSAAEWSKLAAWFFDHKLASANLRWIIQVPRLYSVFRATGSVENFDDVLKNIFAPLHAVTLRPSSDPKLHAFLSAIVGFDSVDDESKPDTAHMDPRRLLPSPKKWTRNEEPPYAYWMYAMATNIRSLNLLRKKRNMSTFEFRPHSGEAGDIDHLVAAYLTTKKINHGIQLRRSPALQYLFYVSRVGIAMSPLSNNRLFLDFQKNPFPKYFKRGLDVSLSTDDPLMLHFTKDPLVEEYSVAAQVWKLSATDICEIARNSVLQSGCEDRFKRHFIGDDYAQEGAAGNDIRMTNVPDIRIMYRHETWVGEKAFISEHAALAVAKNL